MLFILAPVVLEILCLWLLTLALDISVYSKIVMLLWPYNNLINRCQFFPIDEPWSWGARNRASNRARAKPSESPTHDYPYPPLCPIQIPLLFHYFTVSLCVLSGFSVRLSGAMCLTQTCIVRGHWTKPPGSWQNNGLNSPLLYLFLNIFHFRKIQFCFLAPN